MGRVTWPMLPFDYAYASLIRSSLPSPLGGLGHVPGDCQPNYPPSHGCSELLATRGLFRRGPISNRPDGLLSGSASGRLESRAD